MGRCMHVCREGGGGEVERRGEGRGGAERKKREISNQGLLELGIYPQTCMESSEAFI